MMFNLKQNLFVVLLISIFSFTLCSIEKGSVSSQVGEQQVREFVNISGKEYFVKLASHTWIESKAECAALNLSLVTFEGPGEYTAVRQAFQQLGFESFWFWTDGFRAANSSEWVWLREPSVPISEFHWGPGQPSEDNSEDRCINFRVMSGGWYGDNCEFPPYYLSYICE
ncbi:hepatic lectin-like [Neocloeon triangulifer]|uniref:hepatic lectin-like n=1 Tax=Neocloeon triangulifer TaxID=2078957 RepID=UPI00286F3E44|nr:hepatic lectin-like [Neocloeon triangulifer]